MMDIALPRLFFFYGTLIAGSENVTARAIHGRLRPIGPASVSGVLRAIPDPAGWYPALLTGEGRIHGMLYAAADAFTADDLAHLDRWEEFHADQPAHSLYLREAMQVTDAGGANHLAHVYRYNQPLPANACPIPDGDFQAWLTANDFTAYAG